MKVVEYVREHPYIAIGAALVGAIMLYFMFRGGANAPGTSSTAQSALAFQAQNAQAANQLQAISLQEAPQMAAIQAQSAYANSQVQAALQASQLQANAQLTGQQNQLEAQLVADSLNGGFQTQANNQQYQLGLAQLASQQAIASQQTQAQITALNDQNNSAYNLAALSYPFQLSGLQTQIAGASQQAYINSQLQTALASMNMQTLIQDATIGASVQRQANWLNFGNNTVSTIGNVASAYLGGGGGIL